MKAFILVSALVFSSVAFAGPHGEHTADVCSATDAKVCAHIGHMKNFKPKSDSSFMVDILVAKPVSNVKVDLWMPEHNHGTNSPVTVKQHKKNKYEVTKAEFSMAGNWVARVSFDVDNVNHKLEIPLTIPK